MNQTAYNMEFAQSIKKKDNSHMAPIRQTSTPKVAEVKDQFPEDLPDESFNEMQKKSESKPSTSATKQSTSSHSQPTVPAPIQKPRLVLHNPISNERSQVKKVSPKRDTEKDRQSIAKKAVESPAPKQKNQEKKPEKATPVSEKKEKWEEDRRKMKEEIKKNKRTPKKDVPFCLVEIDPSADIPSIKEKEIPSSLIEQQKSSITHKKTQSTLAKKQNEINEDNKKSPIPKKKVRGGRKTLENFSEEDVLVCKAGIKTKVDMLAQNIENNHISKQKQEELHQEDMQNIIVELKNVTNINAYIY